MPAGRPEDAHRVQTSACFSGACSARHHTLVLLLLLLQGLGTPAFAPVPAPSYGPPAAPKASDSLALTNSTVNQLQVGDPTIVAPMGDDLPRNGRLPMGRRLQDS